MRIVSLGDALIGVAQLHGNDRERDTGHRQRGAVVMAQHMVSTFDGKEPRDEAGPGLSTDCEDLTYLLRWGSRPRNLFGVQPFTQRYLRFNGEARHGRRRSQP